jgi:hypothetical protein
MFLATFINYGGTFKAQTVQHEKLAYEKSNIYGALQHGNLRDETQKIFAATCIQFCNI